MTHHTAILLGAILVVIAYGVLPACDRYDKGDAMGPTDCRLELWSVEDDMNRRAAEYCYETKGVYIFNASVQARWRCWVPKIHRVGWAQTFKVTCYEPGK